MDWCEKGGVEGEGKRGSEIGFRGGLLVAIVCQRLEREGGHECYPSMHESSRLISDDSVQQSLTSGMFSSAFGSPSFGGSGI